ncbi:MAG: dTDP-4-dehydrorhamnose reductase [Candidatus Omnitrophica bacterium]|nr:dTDP-4-dehydrorhamnose reductase [Candidatus Omnitrophota bacterium]
MKKIMVLGARGQLGEAFTRYFDRAEIPYIAVDRAMCDVADGPALTGFLAGTDPQALINCSAYNLVDQAEDEVDKAFAVNAQAPRLMAEFCSARKIKLVHFSTDYVFDGRQTTPYIEVDEPGPLSVYGRSKLAGERLVLETGGGHLVFRLSWVQGRGRNNFLYKVREWMSKSAELRIASDEVSVPTFTHRIVDVVCEARKARLAGLYHLTNSGQASRYEWVVEYLRQAGIQDQTVLAVSRNAFGSRAERPGYSVLSNKALARALQITIPHWRDDLKVYVDQLAREGKSA